MKIIRILSVTAVMALVALVAGCYSLMTDAPFETDPDQLKTRTMFDYFESSMDPNRTVFCAAARRAGLEDLINAGNVTCVVPINSAWDPFLYSVGASTVEDVEPAVLRAILEYLVFPGEYRALTMSAGDNVRVESLSGDPIWISRSPTSVDRFRMVINANDEELVFAPAVVLQQDFLFMNNAVAQVVTDFVTYRPKVPFTDEKPVDMDDSMAKKDTLFVTDDTHIFIAASGRDVNYDASQAMGIVASRSASSERVGLFKARLKPIDFVEDIIKAEFTVRVAFVATYANGATCQIDFHSLGNTNWIEGTATYRTIDPALNYPLATSVYLTSGSFIIPGPYGTEAQSQTLFRDNPTYVKFDITGHIMNSYDAAGENPNTPLAFALYDFSPGRNDASTIIRLCTKDWVHAIVPRFLSYIALTGPLPSAMRLRHNNVIITQNGRATITTASFAMEGPAVDDGYDYSEHNIIYMLKTLPTQGILTKYSIPMNSMKCISAGI